MRYIIEITETQRDAIIHAVKENYEQARDYGMPYGSEGNLNEWIDGNRVELEELRRATLLEKTFGRAHHYKEVEEEDSAE